MIEFESRTYNEPNGMRTVTTIHISPWVLKAALCGLGAVVLGLAWVTWGIFAS